MCVGVRARLFAYVGEALLWHTQGVDGSSCAYPVYTVGKRWHAGGLGATTRICELC